jgi:hypothetical protein
VRGAIAKGLGRQLLYGHETAHDQPGGDPPVEPNRRPTAGTVPARWRSHTQPALQQLRLVFAAAAR